MSESWPGSSGAEGGLWLTMDPLGAAGLRQPQTAHHLLRFLEALPVGVVTVDHRGFVLAWNAQAADFLGGLENPPKPVVFDCFEETGRVKALLERCLRNEDPQPAQIFSRRTERGLVSIEITARAVAAEERGDPAAMLLLQDVSGRVQVEGRLKQSILDREFLTLVGTELAVSLDYQVTMRKLAQLVVAYLADWCAINMVADDGTIDRVAVAHVDPTKEDLIVRLQDVHPHDPAAETGVPRVLRTGEPQIHRIVDAELLERTANNPEYLKIVTELGMHSNMIVPISARDETLGTISLVSTREGRVYDQSDLELASELGRRAGLAVFNSRLFQRVKESEQRFASLARTLQESLLPPELPSIPGFEVAALYRAASKYMDVGGDFYDLFEAGDGDWGVVMGDVQGHGAKAASITALARYSMRATALRTLRPMHVLYQVNRSLLRASDDERFFSAVFARLSPGIRPHVVLSNAGHPAPMVIRSTGTVESIGSQGMLLGLFQAPDLNERVLELEDGESMVFFTDGVIEAGAPRNMLGEEGLRQILARCSSMSAQEIVDVINEMLLTWQDEGGHRDDCAVLVLRANRDNRS